MTNTFILQYVCFIIFISFSAFRAEYYVDTSSKSTTLNTGTFSNPFIYFDDVVPLFSNQSSLGIMPIYLNADNNDVYYYYSNQTLIQIKEGSDIILLKYFVFFSWKNKFIFASGTNKSPTIQFQNSQFQIQSSSLTFVNIIIIVKENAVFQFLFNNTGGILTFTVSLSLIS